MTASRLFYASLMATALAGMPAAHAASQQATGAEGPEAVLAPPPVPYGVNLSRMALSVATDSNLNGDYTGAKAKDGAVSARSKWTSGGSTQTHWLTLDLGGPRSVTGFIVRHAGDAGENVNGLNFNTRAFRIQSSTSGTGNWVDEYVVNNTNPSQDVHSLAFSSPRTLRYVRLYIENPGPDAYARIPEFEVWGLPGHVAWEAPYIHQITDTAYNNFNGGVASAASAAVMVLAAYQRLAPWPFTTPGASPRTSDYGKYVSQAYDVKSAFFGAGAFVQSQMDAGGLWAQGAYGACMENLNVSADKLKAYLEWHDLGTSTETAVTLEKVRDELSGGSLVLLGTYMNGTNALHTLLVRGFDEAGNLIVNDPKGKYAGGAWSGSGESIVYSWSQILGPLNRVPQFYIACHAPQYIPLARAKAIAVKNSTARESFVDVMFLHATGEPYYGHSSGVQPQAQLTISTSEGNQGTAVVRSKKTGMVVLVTSATAELAQEPAFRVAGPAAAEAGAQASPTLAAPAIYSNKFGIDSTVRVMNTGLKQAQEVSVRWVGRTGYPSVEQRVEIPANGYLDLSPKQAFGPSAPWVGSLEVASPQAVALTVTDTQLSGGTRSYAGIAKATPTAEVPAAYKDAWGLSTGLVVQNLGGKTANVVADFYDRSGTFVATTSLGAVGAKQAAGVFLPGLTELPSGPNGWTGTVRLRNPEQQPLGTVVTSAKDGAGVAAYNAQGMTGKRYAIPGAQKNLGGRTTSFLVRNASEEAVTFYALFFNEGGTLTTTASYTCPPRGCVGQYLGADPGNPANWPGLPNGWKGSIQLEASKPVISVSTREDSPESISAGNALPQ